MRRELFLEQTGTWNGRTRIADRIDIVNTFEDAFQRNVDNYVNIYTGIFKVNFCNGHFFYP